MRPNTTQARQLTPPVVIVTCPGGGGHLWAKINPKWVNTPKNRSRPPHPLERFWCPDHQAEKAQHIRSRIIEVNAKRSAGYAALPLPITKRCTHPNPTIHEPGAVFPSGKFYRRIKYQPDGTTVVTLDSRCKMCKRQEQTAYRAAHNTEADRVIIRKRQAKGRARRKEARKQLAQDRDKNLPIGPFREWLIQYQRDTSIPLSVLSQKARPKLDKFTLSRVISRDSKYIRQSTVDRIGTAAGYPDLINHLYPVDVVEEAA